MQPWVDLGIPLPRTEPGTYCPVRWSEGSVHYFKPQTTSGDFDGPSSSGSYPDLVGSRRTRYEFGPVDTMTLGLLFERSARVSVEVPSGYGFPLTKRAAPSAGGIHPIHLIVHAYGARVLCRYDPFAHSLREIRTELDPAELRESMSRVVDGEQGVLVLLVAEPGKSAVKYENAASLVWRDAGVLLAFLAMGAESLKLNFAPLGVTGDPWVARLVDEPGLVGVGAAFVGSRMTGAR